MHVKAGLPPRQFRSMLGMGSRKGSILPTCKLCKNTGLPGAKFCGACGTPFPDSRSGPEPDDGDLFGSLAPAQGERDLDDLFSSLPSAPSGDDVGDLFAALAEPPPPRSPGSGAGDLFGSDPAPAPTPARGKAADLDDFFGDGAPEISDLRPGLAAGPVAGADLFGGGDLFATSDPIGIDGLDAPTARGPAVPSPAARTSPAADLFSDAPARDDTLDDLFGGSQAIDPDRLFEGGSGLTGKQTKVGGRDELDDLFGTPASSPGRGPSGSPGTISISGDRPVDLSAPGAGGRRDELEDLFGVPDSTSGSIQSMSIAVPDLDESTSAQGSTAHAFEQLMQERGQEGGPGGAPDLESGDLLAEAHRVADGRTSADMPAEPAAAPGGRDRRKRARGPVLASAVAPPPEGLERLGEFATFAGTACLAGALVQHHVPQAAGVPAPGLALGAALVGGLLHMVTGFRFPLGFQARALTLAAAVVVLPHGLFPPVVTLPPAFLPITMILVLAAGIAHALENVLLARGLRIGLAIVGVYACLSLVRGAAIGTPYDELVLRRALAAPGLEGSLAPDRLALLLKAFDPLFLGVNLFLPAMALAALFDALVQLRRRWWGRLLTRTMTVALLALAIHANLGIYDRLGVPNLRSLATGKAPGGPAGP